MSATHDDPLASGWHLVEDEGFMATVGPIYARDGIYAFRAEQKHANLVGVVHGGMLMSFADDVLGMTVWEAAGRKPCTTVQLNHQFIAPARIGFHFFQARPSTLLAPPFASQSRARAAPIKTHFSLIKFLSFSLLVEWMW